MNTKLDERVALGKLIEKLNTTDMMQILAFVAGYEAGKIDNVHTGTQSQRPPENRPA